jgi:DNA-binding MltR family transcriptional regulator
MRPKQPIAPDLLGDEVQKIDSVLVDGTDLAVALIGTSFLDECLRSLLSAHFRPGGTSEGLLRSGRGALGSYSTRADLAYALGLLDEHALKALRTIAEIRNAFAHSYTDATFSDGEIAAFCSRLDYAYEVFVNQKRAVNAERTRAALDSFFVKPRNCFTYTCVTLGQTLIRAAGEAQKRGAATGTQKAGRPDEGG